MHADPWLRCFTTVADPRLRVFCIPHAGGGASAYRTWAANLPASVELSAVQLPGREDRRHESPPCHLREAAAAIARALRPQVNVPYVLFGHSLGALLAFETAAELRADGAPDPAHLMLCAARAPHRAATAAPLHQLPDDELMAHVRRYDGTPDAIADAPDLVSLFVPLLRADFRLSETYVPPERTPLPGALTVFGGRDDEHIPRSDLAAWREHSRGPFTMRLFPGGHFFVREAQSGFHEAFAGLIARLAAAVS